MQLSKVENGVKKIYINLIWLSQRKDTIYLFHTILLQSTLFAPNSHFLPQFGLVWSRFIGFHRTELIF